MRQARRSLLGLTAVLVALSGTLCTRADTEILVLRNGDRIRGEVTAQDGQKATVETSYGKLVVPLSEIAQREKLPPPQAAPAPAPVPAPPAPPPQPPSFHERYLKNVHGSVQVGVDMGYGTKERQLYSGRVEVTYAKKRFKNTVEYLVAYGKTDDVLSTDRMEGTVKTSFDLDSAQRLYGFNDAGAGYDSVRLIDVGWHEGLGLGYKVWNRTNLVLSAEAGGQYHEYYYSGGAFKENISVLFGETLTWTISPKLTLKQKAQFMPDVRDFSDYRFRFDLNLSYPLWKSMNLNFNVIDLYDSQPPPGVEPNDLTVQAGIGLTF